ncbi:MAG: class I SAM-dependent methyltransferase [Vicinamibacterales bacterium]
MDKRGYFENLAPRWDGLPETPGAAAGTRRFVERLALDEVRWIADVGCGTGILVPHLARAFPDARIIEIDFALSMVRESLRKHAATQLSGICGDAAQLPLVPGSCDALLCFGVLPHLGDPSLLLPELLRPLRRGGTLAVGHTMASHELNAFHAGLGGLVESDRLLPATELAARLREAGAASIVAEEHPGWYFVRAVAGC